ncbi:thioredoxin [Candidatus Uhrbacteria bacterium]|nr:thioredoxin [Candidatus Uhrbacteria bacterium]
MEHTFTDANFQTDVLQSSTPVVVDFWAEWCGPCRMMSPILEELAGEIDETKLKIGKMNVDQNPTVPGQYGIMSIPTFLVFKNGGVVEQMVGSMSKEQFKEKLMKHV